MKIRNAKARYLNLQLFAEPNMNTNTTQDASDGNDLSPTMKTFYNTQLLENARAALYFAQFGKKQPLPQNGGNEVEFRKVDTFAPATTPLTEGVTPDGHKLNMSKMTVPIDQHGDYVTVSDRLELEAVDNIISAATEESGAQAALTLDVLVRNMLLTGTNVIYGGGKTSRAELTPEDKITVKLVHRASTFLKRMNAPEVAGGGYIAIAHPSVISDLMDEDLWIDVQKYKNPEHIYNGEVGKLYNIRFVETTNAKIIAGGADSTNIYCVEVFGKDAYAEIEPSAESLQMLVKQRGSAGTADPLNQRSTIGWKASTGSKIIYPERLVRLEVGSSYSSEDVEN